MPREPFDEPNADKEVQPGVVGSSNDTTQTNHPIDGGTEVGQQTHVTNSREDNEREDERYEDWSNGKNKATT